MILALIVRAETILQNNSKMNLQSQKLRYGKKSVKPQLIHNEQKIFIHNFSTS
jgi:hypothetical protein